MSEKLKEFLDLDKLLELGLHDFIIKKSLIVIIVSEMMRCDPISEKDHFCITVFIWTEKSKHSDPLM